jgi:putative flippase GtrA/ADP-heptose:LPS heptosyltransferase
MELIQYFTRHRIVRYIISGGTSAVINLVVFYVLNLEIGVYYITASILSFAAAFFVSFTLQKFWTFKSHETETHKQMIMYLGNSLFGLGLNTSILFICVHFLQILPLFGQIIAGALTAFCTFQISRNFVFRCSPIYRVAVIMAHGGLGDFLFQLDLAKRLELSDIKVLFVLRKNHSFLGSIADYGGVSAKRIRADGLHYIFAIVFVWIKAIFGEVIIINSFHHELLRIPTRIFYRTSKILSARVLVCKKEFVKNLSYEQMLYVDEELIWQRNNRIVSYLTNRKIDYEFPIIQFETDKPLKDEKYIHIHPVGSLLQKSYPAHKLVSALKIIGKNEKILLTMTPKEESWYMTEELREYISKSTNIKFVSKFFSPLEIIDRIKGAKVFCTVNTGMLWVAIFLRKKVVVCDTYTDFEWNPLPYGDVIRLAHDYDENGNPLHLMLGEHEDGTYYESMYRVEPAVLAKAIRNVYDQTY